MVDRSRWFGRRTSDAVFGDLSDGRAGSHAVGLRSWPLERLELCRRYGVSRDTFYGWRARRASGEADLVLDRSHATRSCPHRTPARSKRKWSICGGIFRIWGLASCWRSGAGRRGCGMAVGLDDRRYPQAGRIGGAVKRRRRPLDPPRRVIAAEAPNEEWASDFKGWFRTRDQQRVDPLTISDSHTRFLIETRIVAPTVAGAKEGFRRAFTPMACRRRSVATTARRLARAGRAG